MLLAKAHRLNPIAQAGTSVDRGKGNNFSYQGLKIQAKQPQVRELIELYQGNPLALKMVAELLKDLFDNNIATFLAPKTLLFKTFVTY